MDRYSVLAFLKVTGPLLAPAIFAVLCVFLPKVALVLVGIFLAVALFTIVMLVRVLIQDEATQMRHNPFRNS